MSAVRKIAGYGWRRDTPDHRDRIYNLEARICRAVELPISYDLADEMPPIYQQGHLGSCTAHAAAALLEHQQARQGEGMRTPSRLFIYYETRRLDGDPVSQDTGGEVRTAIRVLVGDGAPAETSWPYSDADPGRFQQRPSEQAYAEAAAHRSTVYQRIVIGPGAPMRTAISNHLPIAFGFPVPARFENPAWDPSREYLPVPGAGDRIIGAHAVVAVGYDYTRSRFPVAVFKVRNSWGSDWGDGGHFYLDAHWFDPFRRLAEDLWLVQRVT